MTQTFNENVVIDGQADETQLTVQGHSSQDEALQVWEDSGGNDLARVSGEGRLQVGDFDATSEALIEGHNLEDVDKPKRGFHAGGILTGVLNSVVSWVVQELKLKGSGGVSALYSALRVRLENQNTGTMGSGAELRAGDFAIVNEGGSNGNGVPQMTGVHVELLNQSGGYVDAAYGVKVEAANEGEIETIYAIHTGDGTVHIGGDLEVFAFSSSNVPDDPAESGFLKLYMTIEEVDGENVARLYARGSGLSASPQLLGGGVGVGAGGVAASTLSYRYTSAFTLAGYQTIAVPKLLIGTGGQVNLQANATIQITGDMGVL